MILKTDKKEVSVRLTTRKIVELTDKLKGKNLTECYFGMVREQSIPKLAIALQTFCEDEEGRTAFHTQAEVYDFIDDYKKENNASYEDIFNMLTHEVNDEGFFQKRYSEEELIDQQTSYLSGLDMSEIVQKAVQDITKETLKMDDKEI